MVCAEGDLNISNMAAGQWNYSGSLKGMVVQMTQAPV